MAAGNVRASVIPELSFPSPLASPLPPTTPTSPRIHVSSAIFPAPIKEEEEETPTSRQAGPLPRKRGEIGFRDSVHDDLGQDGPSSSTLNLPARHPQERNNSPSTTAPTADASASSTTPETTPDNASAHSAGKCSLLSRLTHKTLPRVYGITGSTFVRFILQLSLMAGTIAGWALVVMHINAATKKSNSSSSGPSDTFGNTAPIFVHVAFGIAFLAQALLLERCVFLMRAERYLFLHPGAILPRTMRREMLTTGSASRNDVLALAPWNRPPVPTYAAALAETGVRGTGDVEDGLIAQQPPPAYGKTRGSVMLLSGFMSDAHRQQVRLARTVSTTSGVSQVSDRPVSYMSHDSAWDERLDVRRAQQLEDTLARLEESGHRSRSPSQDSTRTVMPTRPPPAQLPPPRDDSLPRTTDA